MANWRGHDPELDELAGGQLSLGGGTGDQRPLPGLGAGPAPAPVSHETREPDQPVTR